jgi:hypothetical protein
MPTPAQIIQAAAFEAAMNSTDRLKAAVIYEALAAHSATATEKQVLLSLAERERSLHRDARQMHLALNSFLA